ncbi:MAG: hypothetical protein PHS86_14815, partial [Syntrophaceae bacterium]|nr:hypothetical protein [Syntrophaceae bacterium]
MYLKNFKELERVGRPVRIGIVGLGAMGKGIAYNVCQTPGLRLVLVGDVDSTKLSELRRIIPGVQYDETLDCMEIAESDQIDLFVEASSSITMGFEYTKRAIESGHNVILMNGEVDCFYGPELYELAQKRNVILSSTDGDQYGVLIKLLEEIELM